MKIILTIIITTIYGALLGLPQIVNPAKWQHDISDGTMVTGDVVELIFRVELDENWHLYGTDQNYDIGPMPTAFEFEQNVGFELLGDVVSIATIKEYDPVFEVDVSYFQDKAEFRQKIRILDSNLTIKGAYAYQVCSMIDGKCISKTGDFEYHLQTKKQ